MSVCVCLVGFASLQSTWAHTLRHPCLACSSRCTEYCHSHNNCKKTIIPQKSPSHLPPLSKVRCCRRKNSGDYRRDCHTYRTLSASLTPPLTIPHSVPNPRKTALSFENHQHPCLPCQREARHKPLYCCFLLVPRPPFLFTKPFCRQDGGIASLPFASHHILTAPCQR